jgi:hypothetical protein
MTDGRPVSQYVWCRAHLRPDINSVWILLSCLCEAPSLTRGQRWEYKVFLLSGLEILDRPAPTQLLYRLHYHGFHATRNTAEKAKTDQVGTAVTLQNRNESRLATAILIEEFHVLFKASAKRVHQLDHAQYTFISPTIQPPHVTSPRYWDITKQHTGPSKSVYGPAKWISLCINMANNFQGLLQVESRKMCTMA